MAPELPALDGIRHSFHDLPTGVRVHVAETGPEDAPPVLLLHGWPQHFLMWRGGWTALLLGLAHPGRVQTLLAASVLHPWQPRDRALKNIWRFAYQVPLATPLLGERLVRRNGFITKVIRSGWADKSRWDEAAARSFEEVLREPAGARTG